jgi:hypothetical protein
MKLIRSRVQRFAATAVVLGLATIIPAPTQTISRNAIKIDRRVDDGPCQMSRKYANGTWEISVVRRSYRMGSLGASSEIPSREASETGVGSSACPHATPRKMAWGWEA